MSCSYNPKKNKRGNNFIESGKDIDWYSLNGDNYVRSPTCNENPEKLFCIDLFLTNRPKSFDKKKLSKQVYQFL